MSHDLSRPQRGHALSSVDTKIKREKKRGREEEELKRGQTKRGNGKATLVPISKPGRRSASGTSWNAKRSGIRERLYEKRPGGLWTRYFGLHVQEVNLNTSHKQQEGQIERTSKEKDKRRKEHGRDSATEI